MKNGGRFRTSVPFREAKGLSGKSCGESGACVRPGGLCRMPDCSAGAPFPPMGFSLKPVRMDLRGGEKANAKKWAVFRNSFPAYMSNPARS